MATVTNNRTGGSPRASPPLSISLPAPESTSGVSVDAPSGKVKEVNLPPGFEPMEGVKTNRTLRATASFVTPGEEVAGIGSRKSSMVSVGKGGATVSRRDSFTTADYSAGTQLSGKLRTGSMNSVNDARSSRGGSNCTTPDTFSAKNRGGGGASIPSPTYKQASSRQGGNTKKRGNMTPLSPTSGGSSSSPAAGSPSVPLAAFTAVSSRRRMSVTTSSVTTLPGESSSSVQQTSPVQRPPSPGQNFTVTSVVVGGPGGIGSTTPATPPSRTPPPADAFGNQPLTSSSGVAAKSVSRRPRAVVEATPVAPTPPLTSGSTAGASSRAQTPVPSADGNPVMAYEVGPDGQMVPVYYLPSGQTMPAAGSAMPVVGAPLPVMAGAQGGAQMPQQQPGMQMQSPQYAGGPDATLMQLFQPEQFQGLQVQQPGQAVDGIPMGAVSGYPAAAAPDMWQLVPMQAELAPQEVVGGVAPAFPAMAVGAPGEAVPNFVEGVEALIDLEA